MVDITADLKHVGNLARRRNDLCGQILNLTESVVLTQNPDVIEDEANKYVSLYERRGALVAELTSIHEEIGESGYKALVEAGSEYAGILAESEERLKRTIGIDKTHAEFGEEARRYAMDGIRRVRQGKNMSLKFNETDKTDGLLVDSMN